MERKRKGKESNWFKERKGKERKGKNRQGKHRKGIEKEKQGEGMQLVNMLFPGFPKSILERKAKKRKRKERKAKQWTKKGKDR